MGWSAIINKHEHEPVPPAPPVLQVRETPPIVPVPAPQAEASPSQPLQPPDFEIATAYSGCSKAERWAIEQTLIERNQTPTSELIWYWQQKLQTREPL